MRAPIFFAKAECMPSAPITNRARTEIGLPFESTAWIPLDHAFFHNGFRKRGSFANIRSSLSRLVLQKCIQQMSSRSAVNVGCSAAISVKLAEPRFQMSDGNQTSQADSFHVHLQGGEMRRLLENRFG